MASGQERRAAQAEELVRRHVAAAPARGASSLDHEGARRLPGRPAVRAQAPVVARRSEPAHAPFRAQRERGAGPGKVAVVQTVPGHERAQGPLSIGARGDGQPGTRRRAHASHGQVGPRDRVGAEAHLRPAPREPARERRAPEGLCLVVDDRMLLDQLPAQDVAQPPAPQGVAQPRGARSGLALPAEERDVEPLAVTEDVPVAQPHEDAGLVGLVVGDRQLRGQPRPLGDVEHGLHAGRAALQVQPRGLEEAGGPQPVQAPRERIDTQRRGRPETEGGLHGPRAHTPVAAHLDLHQGHGRRLRSRRTRDRRSGRDLPQAVERAPGRLPSDLDQRLRVGVVVEAPSFEVGTDHEVRALGESRAAVAHEDLHELEADAQHVAVLLRLERRRRGVDRDHHVRAHGARHVHRDVVHDAAVDEDPAVHAHGGQGDRSRHAGAHGAGQAAAPQHHRLAAAQVGGHGPERHREPVEVAPGAEAGHGEELEQQPVEPVVGAARRRQVDLRATEADGQRVGHVVDPPGQRHQRALAPAAEDLLPIDGPDHLGDALGGVARGPQGAQGGAHAGARDAVDPDAGLLEGGQDADVGEAARPAAAQHQADTRPARLRGPAVAGRRRGRGGEEGQRQGGPPDASRGGRRGTPGSAARWSPRPRGPRGSPSARPRGCPRPPDGRGRPRRP